ncbi:hypothetical protein R1flu_013021 [Riccia fluitans]|uniref:EF-hand domain-containing protein n=1 Tax=Riccia fluitans TaxID=41844 RepID=A0ABD1ZC99_9MARC
MNCSTIRSSVRALNFDGDGNIDEDEDKEFIDDYKVGDYHFTLAQRIAVMISPVSGLRLLVSPDVPNLQLVADAPPSLEPDSQVSTNDISIPSPSKP